MVNIKPSYKDGRLPKFFDEMRYVLKLRLTTLYWELS